MIQGCVMGLCEAMLTIFLVTVSIGNPAEELTKLKQYRVDDLCSLNTFAGAQFGKQHTERNSSLRFVPFC